MGHGASNRVKVGMASRKRQSVVGYAGVYFVEALRAAGHGTEKIYYIRYRKQGKLIEEKVGGQYRDNMTAAKAASIRGLRIEGKDASNDEKRALPVPRDRLRNPGTPLTGFGPFLQKPRAPTAPSRMIASVIRCTLPRHWVKRASRS